ncbi:MAG: nucleotidyl transferase AbiEii/AbiGii toxin family protein [Candidatus Hydrogenedentota bacterium]
MDRLLALVAGNFPSLIFIGGTALAEFYLGHRFSEDLDFASPSLAAIDRVEGPLEAILGKSGLKYSLSLPIRGAVVAHVKSGKRGTETVKMEFSTNPHVDKKAVVRFEGLRIASAGLLMDLKWRALSRFEVKDIFDLAALKRAGVNRPWPREIPLCAPSLAHAQTRLGEWERARPDRPGWFTGDENAWSRSLEEMSYFLREYSEEAADFLRGR